MKFKNIVLLLLAFTLACPFVCKAQADQPFEDLFADEPEFLTVEQAFAFDFTQQGDKLVLRWEIADGYYLYKKQFKTAVKKAELGKPSFPPAEQIEDEFYGLSDVFYQQVEVTYPIVESVQDGVVKIRYQGCAVAGFCYPPTTQVVYLSAVGNAAQNADSLASNSNDPNASEQFVLAQRLKDKEGLPVTLLVFIGFGILLAFTPCVFPMYPILSGIVLGQGKSISTTKAFSLSFVYVQGMAITYSLLGLVVASAGAQFQAYLQHPAILITLIVVFLAFALNMFGLYEIQLPSSWQQSLNNISNKQKGGQYTGVFVMGVISGLIASPCTTAPLTAILLTIAQTGDMLLGFGALYALSIGMGIPLILFGVTGGKLLPKAGNWMNIVKVTFGFMMVALALFFVERMLTNLWTELAWAALGLAAFSYYWVMNQDSVTSFMKGVRMLLVFLGLFSSALYGYSTLFPVTPVKASAADHPEFQVVKNLEDFEAKLAKANAQGKSVMVDLYADWCVACKEFEKYTFPDPRVVEALSGTVWMQIDLTDNTPVNMAFQEQFAVLGLPTILFFDKQGNELESARVTGFMKAEPFANHVKQALY